MPIPKPEKDESNQDFIARCMGDSVMNKEYPDRGQRYAVCRRSAGASLIEEIDVTYNESEYGFEEDLNEDNFYVPEESDYLAFASECECECDKEDEDEDEEEYDLAKDKPGLWENIRKKKERLGDNYRPAGPGEKDRPDPDAYKKAQSAENKSKVKLNKPFRTPNGPKKFSVYVRNDKGNVVKVNFGDPNMEIKRDDPERRKGFRARHNCANPGPKWKARYWSCYQWRASSPVKG
jgi:hypothetical protein